MAMACLTFKFNSLIPSEFRFFIVMIKKKKLSVKAMDECGKVPKCQLHLEV